MEVQATKPGYFGKLREVGEKFEVPENAKATWFEPTVEKKPEAKKKPGADLV